MAIDTDSQFLCAKVCKIVNTDRSCSVDCINSAGSSLVCDVKERPFIFFWPPLTPIQGHGGAGANARGRNPPRIGQSIIGHMYHSHLLKNCPNMKNNKTLCVYACLSFFLLVGGCLMRYFSLTLWFCYFQRETGCDSDCMADCVIEWTHRIHTCSHTGVYVHTQIHRCGHPHAEGFWERWWVPPVHRGTGGWASANDWSPSTAGRRSLLSFSIGLKHQLLIWLSVMSEKRIQSTHRNFTLCGN